MPAIITAKHLNLWYGDHHALQDINLEIPANQITALIGPSGCGKSTFLKTLNRMNDLPGYGPVSRGDGCDLAAQADRHGVPEGQSVSHEHL